MSMALGIIGVLALVIGVVMLIVNAIRKNKVRIWGIIAAVGLIFFIIGISLSGSTPMPTPAPVPEPAPAPAPAPTPAPETTEVAPPSEPTITPSEQTYATTIADHSSRVGKAFDELSELMSNPRMGDDEWTFAVAAQLATIRVLYEEVMEIDPPASMAHIHYKYVQSMKHYETATYLIAQGIDELDARLIDQATAEFYTGAQLVNQATELTEEFIEAHSK